MNPHPVTIGTDLEFFLCAKCAYPIGVPTPLVGQWRSKGKTLWCVNGHCNHLPPGEPPAADVEKRRELVRQLHEQEQAEAREVDRRQNKALDAETTLDDRTPLNVCSRCRKSYSSKAWLSRHMMTAHAPAAGP